MSTQGAHFNAAAWLLDRHVDEGRGDRVAIRCQGRSTTYAEVLDRARAVQALLADHGIEAGDRVAKVDGESTDDLDLREFVDRVGGEDGTEVDVVVDRAGERLEFTIVRQVLTPG